MRQIIDLYIGNYKVEWSEPPAILYTYQETELTNPTVVKNSYSKTITIEGTANNNNIFGQYWNVERVQGSGEDSGVYFNASKKTDFTLYVNSEIYESGYCKLDSVRLQGRNILYDITLYGGLGDFFYSLSTDANGEKRKLSSLDFGTDLDFTINMDTVKEAWENIDTEGSKWSTLNFAPCYEGYAEDFDSDKVVINTDGTRLVTTVSKDDKYYRTTDGFVLGKLSDKLNGSEIRDLRSYLQRPVLRMKDLINACCKPENNGGYTVELDSDFFNNLNPYWNDTWLTLPSITQLDYANTQQILTGSTMHTATTTGTLDAYQETELLFSLGDFPDDLKSITVKGTAGVGFGGYPYTSYMWFWNEGGNSYHSGWKMLSSLYIQLVAYNGNTVVGASEAYNLTTPVRHNGRIYYGSNAEYPDNRKYAPMRDMPVRNIFGTFTNSGFVEDGTSIPKVLSLTIDNLSETVTNLKLRYFWGASQDQLNRYGAAYLHDKSEESGWLTQNVGHSSVSTIDFTVSSSSVQAVVGDSIGRTGTEVRKDVLLNTSNSPCDYLLSYGKMFGLYFTKDIAAKTIRIETRKTFYDRETIVDLTEYMDKSKEYKITPITFDNKWYQFGLDKDDSAFKKRYELSYGVDYGCKIVDTGYGFNSEKKDLLNGSCIKSGIEGLEKSKHYIQYADDSLLRPWMATDMTYSLYAVDGETTDMAYPYRNLDGIYPINEGKGLKYYDLFPKVQFHDEDGKMLDGNDVLLFFNGFKDTQTGRANPVNYILSDDNGYMTELNEGTPCWLFTNTEYDTNGNHIAYKLTELPVFELYRTQNNSGSIAQSLDFGAPRELYVPNYTYDRAMTIYDNYWASYIEDMYSADNKILECYVRLAERPNPDWLRRFYWFDNAIWRLNKITDWNVSSFETTKMEFVKVDDVEAYSSNTPEPVASISISLDRYRIGYEGGYVIGAVTAAPDVSWRLFLSDGLTANITGGTGTRTFTIIVPEITEGQQRQYSVTARADASATATITQDMGGYVIITENGDYVGRDMPSSGGTLTLDIKSAYPWVLVSKPDWMTLSASSGTGDTTVTVTVAASEHLVGRTGAVVISDTGRPSKTARWVKTQNSAASLHYLSSGGTKTMDLNDNQAVFVKPEWITINNNGDGTYDFTASENSGSSTRSDSILIYTPSDGTYNMVTVYQDAGSAFSVYPTLLVFDGAGETQPLTISNPDNDTWAAVTRPNWITPVPSGGTSSTTIDVTASTNPSETQRTGTMVIWNQTTDRRYEVGCVQDGNDVVLTGITLTQLNWRYDIPASGGTATSANCEYMVFGHYSDHTQGDLTDRAAVTGSLVVSASSATVRHYVGQMTLTATFGDFTSTANVGVYQAGMDKYLTLDRDSAVFNYTGGTVTINISSNTDWEVIK